MPGQGVTRDNLESADGRTETLKVPQQAQSFDQIQVGDKVAAEYLDPVAIFVRKAPSNGNARPARSHDGLRAVR